MLELLDFDRLEEILVLIIPGFVSLKVWTLINPTAPARPHPPQLGASVVGNPRITNTDT